MFRYNFIVLMLLIVSVATGQQKEFVCTPCGLDCDNKVLSKGGVCSACGMTLVEKSTVNLRNLSIDELCQRIAANPKLILLDVRSPQEFSGSASRASYGHFRNAININVDQLQNRVGELSEYKNQEVIVYCSHSHRSPRAAYFLLTQGFTNVSNMAGGVSSIVTKENNDCLKERFVSHNK
jgi:rhodanese-related sulfurtransferase